jgi:plastocyanin
MPKLTLFHSHNFYRLQARPMLLSESPLLFASNINSLVHVTGRMTGLVDTYDRDRSRVFEVNAVDQLAATCGVTESLAQLHHAQQQRSQEPKVASASGIRTNQVHITDMAFLPASIEVSVGERVVWQNTSTTVHNVVDDETKALNKVDVALPVSAKPFDSGFLQPGQSYARIFNQPGLYRYVCTLHEGNGMNGFIVVRPGTVRTYVAHSRPSGSLSQR